MNSRSRKSITIRVFHYETPVWMSRDHHVCFGACNGAEFAHYLRHHLRRCRLHFSNQSGSSTVQLVSGANQNNRLGFRINEDIGGGWATIATLENGFDIASGDIDFSSN